MIKIWFCDFWYNFNIKESFLFKILKKMDITIKITSNNPDIVFYSVFGDSHMEFKCIKVFYTGENIRPDFNSCDFALSFDYLENENHIRLPLYIWDPKYYNLKNNKDYDGKYFERPFCSTVYIKHVKKRIDFFDLLNTYKKTINGGESDIYITDKIGFQKEFKFCMCFENSSYNGYVTEKIVDAMLSDAIPIYWGSSSISSEFNEDSFIDLNKFNNENECLEYLIFLDNDENEYLKKLNTPWLINNEIPIQNRIEYFIPFFEKIISKI
jgi:hypothetical protein